MIPPLPIDQPKTELPRSVQVQISALRLIHPDGGDAYRVLVELLRLYPHLAPTLLPAVASLSDLSINDAVATIARLAFLRARTSGTNPPSVLARAADELPVRFVRLQREADEAGSG